MPYYPRLIQLLIAAPHRVNAAGEMELSAAEAALLKASDFTDPAPGLWPIPPIPAHAGAPDWLFRALPQLTRAAPLSPPVTPSVPVTPLQTAVEVTAADRLRWRVHDALRKPDHRRILEALMRRTDGPVECRRFQRALHRIKPSAFKEALASLIAAGLVTRVTSDGVGCLLLPADVRELLAEAQIGVRRPRSARAKRRARARGTGGATQSRQLALGQPQAFRRKSRYRPRPIPDRRQHPRQWGKAMRRRLGGLTVQKLYRKFGVHPTAAATEARQKKRQQDHRRQMAPNNSTSYAAATYVTQAQPPVQQGVSDAWFSAGSAARVATALEYHRPIGRDARLAAERNRR